MPEVYLDGERLEFEDKDGRATVAELVEAVNGELIGHRRLVIEVSIDGSKTDLNEAVLNDSINAHSDFRLSSAAVEAVALYGSNTAGEYMRVIREEAGKCASDIRSGAPVAERRLKAVFEGVIEVVKTVDALSRGAARFGVAVFREDASPFCKRALGILETIKKAGAESDSVSLTDALEYELIPLLEEMEKSLFASADSRPC